MGNARTEGHHVSRTALGRRTVLHLTQAVRHPRAVNPTRMGRRHVEKMLVDTQAEKGREYNLGGASRVIPCNLPGVAVTLHLIRSSRTNVYVRGFSSRLSVN